ncbi:transposase [Paraburkholderia youngii]
MNKDAPQRRYELREMFNALRWIVRAGAPWRLLPNNFPPWELVYQQTQRWIQAGCFEAMVSDLRSILRVGQDRRGQPSAVILDGRTLQSTCESGARAGYDGYKRKKGSKIHMAVDTLGQLLAVHVTPANEQERAGWRTGASGAAGHGPDGQGGVCGSGIYRRRARTGGA